MPAERLAPAAPSDFRGDRCRQILVVDDEPALRRFAGRVLSEAGYLVREAADGIEALAVVGSDAGSLDGVLSDVVMPRLNGVELLQRLSVSHPDLPVVLMSGYASEHLEARGIVTPCGLLAKPFSPERLLEEIRRCLRQGP